MGIDVYSHLKQLVTTVFLKAQYTVYLHEHTQRKRERLEEVRKETEKQSNRD